MKKAAAGFHTPRDPVQEPDQAHEGAAGEGHPEDHRNYHRNDGRRAAPARHRQGGGGADRPGGNAAVE